MDYETNIVIDESALDVEWLEQPRLFLQYSKNEHQARRELDYAKERLDLAKAKLDKKMRNDPEKYGIARISEMALDNTAKMQPEWQEANKRFIDATYEYGVARAAVWAFDQRKTALENLVRLHGQNYFAGPRVPRDLSDIRKTRDDRANKTVGRAMQRKKKD